MCASHSSCRNADTLSGLCSRIRRSPPCLLDLPKHRFRRLSSPAAALSVPGWLQPVAPPLGTDASLGGGEREDEEHSRLHLPFLRAAKHQARDVRDRKIERAGCEARGQTTATAKAKEKMFTIGITIAAISETCGEWPRADGGTACVVRRSA